MPPSNEGPASPASDCGPEIKVDQQTSNNSPDSSIQAPSLPNARDCLLQANSKFQQLVDRIHLICDAIDFAATSENPTMALVVAPILHALIVQHCPALFELLDYIEPRLEKAALSVVRRELQALAEGGARHEHRNRI